MFHIDKQKFGALTDMRGKEKGFTQKELAEQTRAYHNKSKWGLICIISILTACLEIKLAYMGGCVTIGLIVTMGLGAGFEIYFCCFAKEKLPAYYDENRICVYTDGLFEMNFPGLSFNNRNWGKILKAGRIWAVAVMLGYPVVSYVETLIFAGVLRDIVDLFCALLFTLGGFFIPIYVVGRKYG